MESSKKVNKHSEIAAGIVSLQVFCWFIIVVPFFQDYSGNDPQGMEGLIFLFTTVPGMLIVFLTNFYLVFKRSLKVSFRFIAASNILGLIVASYALNNV